MYTYLEAGMEPGGAIIRWDWICVIKAFLAVFMGMELELRSTLLTTQANIYLPISHTHSD